MGLAIQSKNDNANESNRAEIQQPEVVVVSAAESETRSKQSSDETSRIMNDNLFQESQPSKFGPVQQVSYYIRSVETRQGVE